MKQPKNMRIIAQHMRSHDVSKKGASEFDGL